MKITVEPRKQRWVSRGTPVRLWRGLTEDGHPVLLAVVGIAAERGVIADEHLEAVLGDEPPVTGVGPNGCTVLAADKNDEIKFGFWWV